MAASLVRLFRQPALLEQSIGWLLDHDYQVVRLDASGWTREENLHTAIAKALTFPDYYRRNLHALNNCLSAIAAFESGARAHATGPVALLTRYPTCLPPCP